MIALYENRCTILFMVRLLIKAVEVFKKIEAQLTTLISRGLEVVGILPIKRWVERTPLASGMVIFFQAWCAVLFVAALIHSAHYSDSAYSLHENQNWVAFIFGMQRYYKVRLQQQAIRMKHDEPKDAVYLDTLVGLGANYPG